MIRNQLSPHTKLSLYYVDIIIDDNELSDDTGGNISLSRIY